MEIEEYQAGAVEELDNDTVTKYKMAADIANKTMLQLVSFTQPACVIFIGADDLTAGADIAQLCAFGDQFIHEQLAGVFTRGDVEKGLAFPTCISVNECVSNFSPLPNESVNLKAGDVAKITLGVQIDGQIAVFGHTHVAGVRDEPLQGPGADAICAAHVAAEVVLRMLRPGVSSDEITNAIGAVAAEYGCNPVRTAVTHNMKRFILEGERTIPSYVDLKDKNPVPPFEISDNDVFNVDIQMSTGEGIPKAMETRTTVHQRDLTANFQLRAKGSRQLYADITKRFPTMPFCSRELDGMRDILRLKECVNHGLLVEFPVTCEKSNQFVAQQKFTALVQNKVTTRLTSHPAPYVHSVYEVQSQQLQEVLRQPAKIDGPAVPLPPASD